MLDYMCVCGGRRVRERHAFSCFKHVDYRGAGVV